MIVRRAPATSALGREIAEKSHEGETPWGLTDQLLAACFDTLRQLVWIQSDDGAKGKNRPKPLPRPGVKPDVDVSQIGSGPVPLAEMAALMARRNPAQHNN